MSGLISLLQSLAIPVVMLGVVFVAWAAFSAALRLRGYSLSEQIVELNNHAVGIRFGGYILAVFVAFVLLIHPSGVSFGVDVDLIGMYSVIVVGLLIISQYVNDWAILYDFSNNFEVMCRKNSAIATIEFSTYISTALILDGALSGWEGGLWVALGWFVVGQVFLILLGFLYRRVVHDVGAALDSQNQAVAFSFGGFLLAGGLLMSSAVAGEFHGWGQDLWVVMKYALVWLLLMGLAHLVTGKLFLRGSSLKEEIIVDKNIGAGIMEAAVFIGVTFIFTRVW